MFHPHFFHPKFHSHHGNDVITDAFFLVAACKVEQDLQRVRSEEQERQLQSERDRNNEAESKVRSDRYGQWDVQ